jgi:hypothetical protein
MSRTTPRSYYYLFVTPNLYDYLEMPSDIRRGFNASVSAYQLTDIMWGFYKRIDRSKLSQWRNKDSFKKDLGKREPFYLTIQSVATAYKHLYTEGSYEVPSPGPARIIVPKEDTELESQQGDVIMRRRNGSEFSLTAALTAVVEKLWPDVLPTEDGS